MRSLSWRVCVSDAKMFENSLRTDEYDVFRVGQGQLAWVRYNAGL